MRINYFLKSLVFFMLALTVTGMTAANVDTRAAQAKAVQFLNSQPGTRFMASSASLRLTHAEKSSVKADANDNRPQGDVVAEPFKNLEGEPASVALKLDGEYTNVFTGEKVSGEFAATIAPGDFIVLTK